MKLFEAAYDIFEALVQLNEANVINIKDDFEGAGSMQKYLQHYAENLPDTVQKPFIKKMSRLFVNDDRFHYAVRKLPDNAPDWAKEAQQAGELVYFKSSPELDSKMEHLSHYLSAIYQDAANTADPDAQAIAAREVQGFPKAESLDILIKKSDEYFKRGSKKASKKDETGMKEIMDAGDGYQWFLLQSADAYRRVGKVLQNCIGSFYTREKTTREGQEIVVLRGPSGDFHVAARIKNADHEIQEMKGKNNKPPIDKYMVPVIKFVNKMKLKLANYAQQDFKRAGYFYIDDNLYSRQDAIKKFVSKQELGKTEDGKTLVQINAGNSQIAEEMFGDVYPEFKIHFSRGAGGAGAHMQIYELRQNDKPLITGLVANKILEALHRHRGGVSMTNEGLVVEGDNVKANKGTGAMFVKELVRRGLITGVAPGMQKELFWNDRVQLNTETGEFDPIQPGKKFKTSDEGLEWEEHTNDQLVQQIKRSLDQDTSRTWQQDTSIKNIDPKDIVGVFIAPTTRKSRRYGADDEENVSLVMLKTKQGMLVPAVVSPDGQSVDTTSIGVDGTIHGQTRKRNLAIINNSIALANKENADLTKSFRYSNGIIKDGDEYKKYVPKKRELSGDPSGVLYDLTDLDLGDRLTAINTITTGGTTRRREEAEENSIYGDDIDLSNRIDAAIKGEKFKRKGYYGGGRQVADDASDWSGKEARDIYKTVFGAVPNKVYLVNVKYGSDKEHQVLMLTDDNRVVLIDNATTNHTFQRWGDYDTVADQLNAFAKEHNLTFDRNAMGKTNELRIHDNQVKSATNVQKGRLETMKQRGKIGLEGTDSLPFANGYSLQRMAPDLQAQWSRKGLKSDTVPGEAWTLVNSDGNPEAIITVKDNAVQSMFVKSSKTTYRDRDIPEDSILRIKEKRLTKGPMQYIKAAMDTFGWGVKNVAQFAIKPDSKQHKILRALARRGGARTDVLQRAGTAMGSAAGWDRPGAADRHLYELGLISASRMGRRIQLDINQLGRSVLAELEKGKSINTTGVFTPSEIESGWEKPKPKQAPVQARTSGQRGTVTGRTKAGSKAEQALNAFQTFVDNNERIPTRSEFMQTLQADPFNMSRAGAQTYYYTTKAKYQKRQEQAQANESFDRLLSKAAALRSDRKPFSALRTLLVS